MSLTLSYAGDGEKRGRRGAGTKRARGYTKGCSGMNDPLSECRLLHCLVARRAEIDDE